jgi:hypothetical protein
MAVTRAVEEMVAKLNERHLWYSSKPGRGHLVLTKDSHKRRYLLNQE